MNLTARAVAGASLGEKQIPRPEIKSPDQNIDNVICSLPVIYHRNQGFEFDSHPLPMMQFYQSHTEPQSHRATEPQSHRATEPQSHRATEPQSHTATQPHSHPKP